MIDYLKFLRDEYPLLGFGLSFTFFSSFGQTFLISLFVPYFLVEFALGNGEFGVLYAVATLGSALLLPWTGSWFDRIRLTRFSLAVVVLMACSALLLAVSWSPLALFAGLLGLRLAGQGLSGHAAMGAMARYYGPGRGKALSISGLGFPLGEASLPLLVAGCIVWLGWRGSWVLVAVLAVLVFAPTLRLLLRRSGVELDPARAEAKDGEPVGEWNPELRSWSRREVLRDSRFWLILPAALLPPFWTTGLFLYQTAIAGLKGWSIPLMASAFTAFAVTRFLLALGTGNLVDRFSARQIYPFCVLPMAGSLALLLGFQDAWTAFVFMAFLGVTAGMSGTVKPAVWAELYGIRHLGSIKSMMVALMVLSTAVSPVLMGWVLDRGGDLDGILTWGIVSILVASFMAFRALGPATPEGLGPERFG
ncbi:MAG: MFS transporter [Gemmatimonadota bacterium]